MSHEIEVMAVADVDEVTSSITSEVVRATAERDPGTANLVPKQIGTAEVSSPAIGKGVLIKTPDGVAKLSLDDSGGLLIDLTGLAFTLQSGQSKIVGNGTSLILTGNPVIVNGQQFPAP